MSRISVGRLWFAGIPPGDIGWILVITPDTYPEYSLMDTEIIPRTAPPQLHTWSFGKKQKLNIKSWTSDTVLMVTMTINGRPLRRSQLRIWAALFPPFPLPPSHWHPALTSTWCWTQKQSNEPQVNKKCCGSLSIYYYDILPLDIPKYVKKLVF